MYENAKYATTSTHSQHHDHGAFSFMQFASHASVADRVASCVASQKSFCESRYNLYMTCTVILYETIIFVLFLVLHLAHITIINMHACSTSSAVAEVPDLLHV